MMDATNKLIRFANECENMAKSARGAHDKSAWQELAQRWRQCAETSQNHRAALRH
jgi:hypothetical protein